MSENNVNNLESDEPNRAELAEYYLKKHRITELFDNLTASLVYERPENPKLFMIEYIERLRSAKAVNVDYPCIFDESNVRSFFGIMDPANKGYIDHAQYTSGMKNLGVTAYERNPPGSDNDQISLNTFLSETKAGLLVSTATFASSEEF